MAEYSNEISLRQFFESWIAWFSKHRESVREEEIITFCLTKIPKRLSFLLKHSITFEELFSGIAILEKASVRHIEHKPEPNKCSSCGIKGHSNIYCSTHIGLYRVHFNLRRLAIEKEQQNSNPSIRRIVRE